MKFLKLWLLFGIYFCANSLFAQKVTPRFIESDLVKSFKNFKQWVGKESSEQYDAVRAKDNAAYEFEKKIKLYTNRYAFTINQQFSSLKKEKITILTSSDSLFRIYSWENERYEYENLFQFKSGQKTKGILLVDTIKKGDEGYVPRYSKLYTLKEGAVTYYLGVYDADYSRQAYGMGIRVFSIIKGYLNKNTKIIKTATGLHSTIYFNYNVFSQRNDHWPEISLDNKTRILYIPILSEKDKLTSKYIRYKFTGKYFEKLK